MEALTYAALVLAWGAPLIALQWAFGWRSLVVEWRPLALTVVLTTVYFGFADVAALRDGIWEINPDKSIALRGGGFVPEEWLFFLVTNTVIVQTVILALDDDVRGRVRNLLKRG